MEAWKHGSISPTAPRPALNAIDYLHMLCNGTTLNMDWRPASAPVVLMLLLAVCTTLPPTSCDHHDMYVSQEAREQQSNHTPGRYHTHPDRAHAARVVDKHSCLEGDCHAGISSRRHHDGRIFVSEYHDGRVHRGHGFATHSSGAVVEGVFDSGVLELGVLVHGFTRYSGHFKPAPAGSDLPWSSVLHGHVLTTLRNGTRWSSTWEHGRPVSGQTRASFPPGNDHSIYIGRWARGLPNGHGIWINGSYRYEGGFVDGLGNGWGLEILKTGDRYDGEFRMGRRHGKGVLAVSDHTIFRGEWANGKKHGVGHLISPGFLFGHYVTRQIYINGHLQHEASSEL